MSINNRERSFGARRVSFSVDTAAVATGVTTVVDIVPFNGLVTGVYAAAFGLSNTPTTSFSLYRFIAGATNAGFTAIGLGATLTIPAFGTSGFVYFGATINGMTTANVIGVTCLQGDLLVALSGGSNAAVASSIQGAVVQATDEYVAWPGL